MKKAKTRGAVLKVALIGNGAIARVIAQFCAERPQQFSIVGALGLASLDTQSVHSHPLIYELPSLLALAPDLAIECAGHSAVRAFAVPILESGTDLLIVSTGSLADDELWSSIKTAAESSGARVKLPAGALPGVEALVAARLSSLAHVHLQSSKPPNAWKGTPAEAQFDLDHLHCKTMIFDGSARGAALGYPKNANVAATAALAGLGFEQTRVTLFADPNITQNIHRLEAEGAFGSFALTISNHPAPDNPKTSLMAALSILRVIENEAAAIIL